jgi:hypothetical protein
MAVNNTSWRSQEEFDDGDFLYPPDEESEDSDDEQYDDENDDEAEGWEDNPFDGPATPEY